MRKEHWPQSQMQELSPGTATSSLCGFEQATNLRTSVSPSMPCRQCSDSQLSAFQRERHATGAQSVLLAPPPLCLFVAR